MIGKLTVLGEHGAGLEEGYDPAVLLEGTGHLLPGYELRHLLGELPELLKIDVSVRQSGIKSNQSERLIIQSTFFFGSKIHTERLS